MIKQASDKPPLLGQVIIFRLQNSYSLLQCCDKAEVMAMATQLYPQAGNPRLQLSQCHC